MTDYIDVNTIATKTVVTAVERGPFTDTTTVISSTTEVFFEVANTVDFDVIGTTTEFSPIEVYTVHISTHDYDYNPWNVTVVSGTTAYSTAGSIGTAGDDGVIT